MFIIFPPNCGNRGWVRFFFGNFMHMRDPCPLRMPVVFFGEEDQQEWICDDVWGGNLDEVCNTNLFPSWLYMGLPVTAT